MAPRVFEPVLVSFSTVFSLCSHDLLYALKMHLRQVDFRERVIIVKLHTFRPVVPLDAAETRKVTAARTMFFHALVVAEDGIVVADSATLLT